MTGSGSGAGRRPVPITDAPTADRYDVVIVGGAVIGSSIAWFLSDHFDFDGSILVVERDMTYENSSTAHTNSCMRQQFSNALNIEISQFGAEFVRDFRTYMGGETVGSAGNGGADRDEVPEIHVNHYGYMYLASDEAFAATLRRNQAVQAGLGAGTRIWSPSEIKAEYPFYNVDDIVCGSHNLVDEGYFDSGTMFDVMRRRARMAGVEYARGEVVGLDVVGLGSGRESGEGGDRMVTTVRLASGRTISCGTVVNAAGPRASLVAAMAGIELPVEPRKRFTFIFDAAEPLPRDLPLTIDPTGVHVRSDGGSYMTGCSPEPDPVVDHNDFTMDDDIFETKIWPALAHRIPAFERIKVVTRWAGHYAHNLLDQNVVVGPHPRIPNFVFANGFSGHGMQQSPAVGRAVAEHIVHGGYRSLDLAPLGYQRIIDGEPFIESAVI